MEACPKPYRIAALLLVPRIHLRYRVFIHPNLLDPMSGFRGTFGNPKDDKVVAFVYDKLEALSKNQRKRVLKIIQRMLLDRARLLEVSDVDFRVRAAKAIKADALSDIHFIAETIIGEIPSNPLPEALKLTRDVLGLESRLENLANRYYRFKNIDQENMIGS